MGCWTMDHLDCSTALLVYNFCTLMLHLTASTKGLCPAFVAPLLCRNGRVVVQGGVENGAIVWEGLECSDTADESLHSMSSAMFGTLDSLMENSKFYTLEDEWLSDWPTTGWCDIKRLLQVFCKVPSKMMKLLDVTRVQAPTTLVVEVDNKVIVFTRQMSLFELYDSA